MSQSQKQAQHLFHFMGFSSYLVLGGADSGLQRLASAWDSDKPFREGEANMQLDDLSRNKWH